MRPEPRSTEDREALLGRALLGRLREVRDLLVAAGPVAAARAGSPDAAERTAAHREPAAASRWEEGLRLLMVRALAAARDRPAPGPDRALFFALLADLEAPARSEDLRYLDAWNNAFEVLLRWPREALARDDARDALRSYGALLESHLGRLGGRR